MPGQVGPESGGAGGGISGTANTVAKFTSASSVGNSRVTDDGTDIVANSGAGAFEAGDTGFVGNGCQIEADDAAKRVYLQANGNGNFIQTVTLEGGDTEGKVSLVAQGPGGTQTLNLLSSTNEMVLTTGAIRPASDNTTDAGTSAAGAFKTVYAYTTKLVPVAFASLPASPAEGMMAAVNNSNTATWGATIAGGGANKVLAYYNGTNWTVAGK